jgi:uncharacterized protein
MFDLPLFPLNTVLFPGMPLNLHIFEERYKQMIGWCLEMDQPFGVILIRQGLEAHGPLAVPHEVGVTARITEVEQLSEGRMNITALGESRFRVVQLNYDLPYLSGQVEFFPFENPDPRALTQSVIRLRPWVERYMEILTRVSEISLDPHQLPRDPLVLAHLAAVLLQLPQAEKQDLLASERATDLVNEMLALYKREVALLKVIVDGRGAVSADHFSPN